ncbi:MAG: hypothetical protein Q8P10_01550 [bacterium]|nr:hypothetical protein [bacterium]
MKKIFKFVIVLILIVFSVSLIFYIYWPFARNFINEKIAVGDALFHLANIVSVQRNPSFPIMAWRPEYGGYPLVEGYPLVHNYLIQPFLAVFKSFLVVDYYAAVFLLIYYIIAFFLLFYVSRNVFLALVFALVLIYGADSHMSLSVNAFINFTASQFLLPLILLLTIIAREKNSTRLFFLTAVILSFSFYAHGSLTGYIIIPTIFPFLILNNMGKISKDSIFRMVKFFLVFAFISSLQIYQFIDYSAQGYLRGIKMFPLNTIPGRFLDLITWMNPVLLPLLIIFIPLFIIASRKSFPRIAPYLFSLVFVIFMFTLGLFNITSLNIVLLAVRVLLGVSLSFLLLFAIVVRELTGSNLRKTVIVGTINMVVGVIYLYFTLIIKSPHLVPDTLRPYDPYLYRQLTADDKLGIKQGTIWTSQFKTKYDLISSYSPPSWSKSFDNYRTDGLSWAIYTVWPTWSTETRYKGRFPMAKGLPLDWQGLVTAAEYGNLGEAGTPDKSQWAINQSIFFFDWYGIRHVEIGDGEPFFADFLRKKPIVTNVDKISSTSYYNIDKNYVGPMYAPSNVKTMAVISPEIQYDNFIRTLSYSEFTSKRLIPIYLGDNVSAIDIDNLKYFDSVFLYGYKKPIFGSNIWNILNDYVKNGGKLIIETGQKVSETESANLPEVFPVKRTQMAVVDKEWVAEVKENNLTQNVRQSDFSPLKTKYLPFAVSQANPESLKDWAKPVLIKDGNVVMAFGQFGKGSVVWSGLNLPFHAIDNRNTSETVIFANILNWFFPNEEALIESFKVEYPNPEKIVISSNEGKGFLVKENYNPGWVATLNGKGIKIYKAGLFQMYIPLDQISGTQTLVLNYYGNPLHWALFAVSFTSLIGISIYIFFNKNPLLFVAKRSISLTRKLPKQDLKSEEEDY